MVKTYLRYVAAGSHGVIASPACNIAVDAGGQHVYTGQLEHVGVWNIKRGVQMHQLTPPGSDASSRSEVTCVAVSPTGRYLACGYADGMVRLFDAARMVLAIALNGHKKAVATLSFSDDGMQLASGGRDTDVILWDVVAEAGVARLRGHKDEVTDTAFLRRPGAAASAGEADGGAAAGGRQTLLVTCSKDTLVKVWDLLSRQCVQTIVGTRVEAWSLCVPPAGDRVLLGAGDNQLRVFALGGRPAPLGSAATDGSAEDADGDAVMGSIAGAAAVASSGSAAGSGGEEDVLVPMGSLVRQTGERAARVRCSADGQLVAVQSAGKLVEVYRRRSPAEARKRVVRRLRRHREKLAKRAAVAAGGAGTASKAAAADADDDNDALYGDAAGGFAMLGTTLADVDAALRSLEAEEKAAAASAGAPAAVAAAAGASAGGASNLLAAGDEWELVGIASTSSKISSFALLPRAPAAGSAGAAGGGAAADSVQLLLSMHNNELDVYTLPLSAEAAAALGAGTVTTAAGITVAEALHSRSIAQQGHRSDVRALAASSDNTLLLSASAGQAKVWNSKTGSCVRTLDLGEATGLCAAFGPGNRHAFIGCKDGALMVFDLASADLLETRAAHDGALWSMAVRPDSKGLATGGADKQVLFWDFDLIDVPAGGGDAAAAANGKKGSKGAAAAAAAAGAPPTLKQLTLVHTRTLKLTDEVLCLRYSHHKDPTRLLLAVALLDATVKVFFDDTLRFFLSLYGHKLPIMAMDISADNTLLVTASADKNVKLWGLDFGDCHRSFFAHADSVMAVSFVANTHYFFSAGKDRLVKYWDGDRFEQILTLEGHKGEVWALTASSDGSFIATGGHDRSIRIWRRTDEQVFLEEEREKELEGLLQRELRDPDGDAVLEGGDAVGAVGEDGMAVPTSGTVVDGPVAAVPVGGGMGAAGGDSATSVVAHATAETMKGTDRLLEALALAAEEADKWLEYKQDVDAAVAAGSDPADITPPTRDPQLLGLTPAAYVLRTMRSLRPSDVDQVLLVLPFGEAMRLLRYLHHLLRQGRGVELCARAALLLLRVHHKQIVANQTHLPTVVALRDALHAAVTAHRSHVGFNIAGLRFMEATVLADVAAAPLSGGAGGRERGGGRGRGRGRASSAGANAGSNGGGAAGRKGATGDAEGFRFGKRQKVNLF